jgi:hypothetical protein
MRTAPIIGVILALSVAFALLAGSGIGASIFGESPGDSDAARTLEEVGEDAEVGGEDVEDDSGVSADVAGDNEPTLVGFAISGGQFIVQLIGAIALLPVTLTRLGFPNYFAVPAGLFAQIIGTVGFYQFLRTGELI